MVRTLLGQDDAAGPATGPSTPVPRWTLSPVSSPPSSCPLVQSPRQPVSCTDWLGLSRDGTAFLGPTGPWVWTDQGPFAFFLQALASRESEGAHLPS